MKMESFCTCFLVLLIVPGFVVTFSLHPETSEIKTKDNLPSKHARSTNLNPPKDAYILLHSLKKIQNLDGRSPVCKICQSFSVDEITYDYFCLPDSEGMNGEVCDRLTILGTTTTTNIGFACKLLLLRRPFICK
ncbi:hypothetical protein Ocin01_14002 [Orchesella cincta]|uniref:Uncharacterized protein n=1 Tax=Orchesella cincta TaxID=48709 RepID=A0A1D2MI74_ORCCI|nr:hypothetical protein Ocin01_14002 [Orchesella cincta]